MVTDWDAISPREVERMAVSISPGGWQVERERPIATLLGSCVAVCMFDPVAGIGGMNHFMLPSMRNSSQDVDSVLSGDYAMEVLLNGMLGRGAQRDRIRAKAFGAGTIISSLTATGIGARNAEFACEWLRHENIPLLASDFLGPWSRKVLFVPSTGLVWCRRMQTTLASAQEIAREEAIYAESLQRKAVSNNVELF